MIQQLTVCYIAYNLTQRTKMTIDIEKALLTSSEIEETEPNPGQEVGELSQTWFENDIEPDRNFSMAYKPSITVEPDVIKKASPEIKRSGLGSMD